MGEMLETRRSGLFAVMHASSVLENRVEAKLSEVGLSLAKLAALDRLSQAGECLALGQLAERLSCVKSNVTQLIDRLEADGLVSRIADPNDRRSRLAVLTDAGRNLHAKGRQIQENAERELFSTLTPSESASLYAILEKLKT
jgi:DNA-binding MarR family transcriptional regulator